MQRLLKKYGLTMVLCALCATGTLEASPELTLPKSAPAQEEQQEVDFLKVQRGFSIATIHLHHREDPSASTGHGPHQQGLHSGSRQDGPTCSCRAVPSSLS